MVERQRGDRPRRLRAARDHDGLVGGEHLRHEALQECRRRRRPLRGLEEDAVPRGDRRGQRQERELHRVVPRRQDAHHALGLAPDVGAAGQGAQHARAPRLRPARQAADEVADRVPREGDLGDLRLQRGPVAEVPRDGRDDLGPPRVERRGERAQPRDPRVAPAAPRRARRPPAERRRGRPDRSLEIVAPPAPDRAPPAPRAGERDHWIASVTTTPTGWSRTESGACRIRSASRARGTTERQRQRREQGGPARAEREAEGQQEPRQHVPAAEQHRPDRQRHGPRHPLGGVLDEPGPGSDQASYIRQDASGVASTTSVRCRSARTLRGSVSPSCIRWRNAAVAARPGRRPRRGRSSAARSPRRSAHRRKRRAIGRQVAEQQDLDRRNDQRFARGCPSRWRGKPLDQVERPSSRSACSRATAGASRTSASRNSRTGWPAPQASWCAGVLPCRSTPSAAAPPVSSRTRGSAAAAARRWPPVASWSRRRDDHLDLRAASARARPRAGGEVRRLVTGRDRGSRPAGRLLPPVRQGSAPRQHRQVRERHPNSAASATATSASAVRQHRRHRAGPRIVPRIGVLPARAWRGPATSPGRLPPTPTRPSAAPVEPLRVAGLMASTAPVHGRLRCPREVGARASRAGRPGRPSIGAPKAPAPRRISRTRTGIPAPAAPPPRALPGASSRDSPSWNTHRCARVGEGALRREPEDVAGSASMRRPHRSSRARARRRPRRASRRCRSAA